MTLGVVVHGNQVSAALYSPGPATTVRACMLAVLLVADQTSVCNLRLIGDAMM